MRLRVAACWALALLLAGPEDASAQQVYLQFYEVKDGLSHGRVPAISSDASGYLWFGAWEGLSCFDGERFTRYDVGDGLLDPLVSAIAHDAHGGLWAATWGRGLAWLPRMPAPGRPKVETFAIGPQRQAGLAFDCALDRDQRLWMATELGVYRGVHSVPRASTEGARDSVRFEATEFRDIARLTLAKDGALWLAAPRALLRSNGARFDSLRIPGDRAFAAADLIPDDAGGVWFAAQRTVWRVTPGASAASTAAAVWDSIPLALPDGVVIRCLASENPSTLWIGTSGGLYRLRDGEWTHWSRADGLRDDFVRALGFDREGELWFSNDARGVARFSGEAIVGFRELESDDEVHCLSVVVGRDQRAYATTARRGILEMRDGIGELVPGSLAPEFNDINYCLVQDKHEDWWSGSAFGLFHIPGPELDFRRARRVDPIDGSAGTPIRVIGLGYDEPRDRLWVGGASDTIWSVDLSQRGRPRFEALRVPFSDSLTGIRAFAFDRSGRTWISGFVGLAIWDGVEMKLLGARHGLPDMRARCLYLDSSGRLWVGFRHDGAVVCDEPEASTPHFRSIGDRASFASSTVWGITSDSADRIYFATGRGLDRWAPETGQIEHVSMRDGLPGETVLDVTTDGSGRIWIATNGGVSRFDPELEPAAAAIPPVYLTSVQLAGETFPLPRGGSARVGPFELGPSRNNLRIEYVAPSFRRPVRYQYRLEGADDDWQTPTPLRTVQYAHLAPGSYRFTVRTLDPEGAPNSNQAELTLRILPPIWQRTWFLALAGGALGAAALAWHRLRVRRILELEGIRQRIASDLHDEIGSGLAQIAVWSEMARRDAPPKSAPFLEQSATLARSLRDSMSDIVWSIDPRRDRLSDLIERVRQFAFDLLATQGMRVEFHVPSDDQLSGVPLAPDTRRHLYLWLKEALTNVGRHAAASHATVTVELRGRGLVMEVCDNGRGYDVERTTRGHGLSSLAQRASALRGAQEIISTPGEGTRLRLEAPLPRPRTLV